MKLDELIKARNPDISFSIYVDKPICSGNWVILPKPEYDKLLEIIRANGDITEFCKQIDVELFIENEK